MVELPRLFDTLARLVVYPGSGWKTDLAAARERLEMDGHTDPAVLVGRFIDAVSPLTATATEELFTRTFDINPVISLEVGWHLFGEQYDRGAFLVFMRQQLRAFGLPEGGELPDHLMNVLRLVGRLDPEPAGCAVRESLRPAMDKMLAGFEGKNNPYEWVLEAIRAVATAHYPGGPAHLPIAASPRGGSIGGKRRFNA